MRARRLAKTGLGLLRRHRTGEQKAVLLILGCQRSGTTLLTRIFERDWQVKVFPEFSPLSSDDRRHRIRLNRLDKVVATLDATPEPFVVAKPLVETQNVHRLLEHLPGSRAIWLYRPFTDVAASDLHHFGERNGIDNIRPIARGDEANWRAEHVSAATREIVAGHFTEDMNVYDAAALFWFARNTLYFDNRLDQPPWRERVMPLRYEQLIHDPDGTMHRVYAFAGRPFPGPHLVAEVHRQSIGKGRAAPVSPAIRTLCQDLLERLDAVAGFAPLA